MKRLLLLFLAAVLLLCGCSAPQVQDFAPDEAERLVIYTSHKKDVWWPIVREFEARTGIWVQVVQGGTNELLEQLKKLSDFYDGIYSQSGEYPAWEYCRTLFCGIPW